MVSSTQKRIPKRNPLDRAMQDIRQFQYISRDGADFVFRLVCVNAKSICHVGPQAYAYRENIILYEKHELSESERFKLAL